MIPLVLLPAMLCDEELYRAQTADLAADAETLTLTVAEPSLHEAVQSVLRRAPTRFALAGTSAGGNLALEIAAHAPERIVGLWLMGTNPGASADPAGARRQSERVQAGQLDLVIEELAARAVYPNGPRAATAIDTFCRMARRTGPAGFVRQNEAMIARSARWDALAALAVPTLLVWGRHDQFSSVDRAREIAARLRDGRLVVLEDCGHLPTLEQPTACTVAAREWLRRLRTPDVAE
jgi:pimeloyl-ACP methyl ester carboxylesterase